jgi:hypothetical protein
MESVDVCFGEPYVEDVAPNDVEWGYYCPRLVDHSELKPFEVLTSSRPKIETQLAATNGVEALHDVGPFLFSPFTKLGILQESTKTFGFANYRFQEIASTSSFANEASHLGVFFSKDSKDFEFGEC